MPCNILHQNGSILLKAIDTLFALIIAVYVCYTYREINMANCSNASIAVFRFLVAMPEIG